jgi:Domain of unknown function (DUF4145)
LRKSKKGWSRNCRLYFALNWRIFGTRLAPKGASSSRALDYSLWTHLLAKFQTDPSPSMKCPHCLTAFHDDHERLDLQEDGTSHFVLVKSLCPTCHRFIIALHERFDRTGINKYNKEREFLCYPKATSRTPIGPEGPPEFADDYKEACLTLADSPKASAALCRRCLQHLLREKAGIKKDDLAREIQQVIDSSQLKASGKFQRISRKLPPAARSSLLLVSARGVGGGVWLMIHMRIFQASPSRT